MFEKLSKKQRTMIYFAIAFFVTIILALIHYFIQGWILLAVVVIAVVEYICIFYILYLPLKIKAE